MTPLAPTRYPRLLRAACVLALVGLAFIAWSVLDPRPMPVILAMSIGQVVGTGSLLLFLLVVVADLRRMEDHDEAVDEPAKKT